jgi:hypothetical protein
VFGGLPSRIRPFPRNEEILPSLLCLLVIPWDSKERFLVVFFNASHSEATEHDFQDLEKKGNISGVSGDGENHLRAFQGVPQHRRPGYKPIVDAKPVLGAPRKGTKRDFDDEGKGRQYSTSIRRCIGHDPKQ